MTDFEKYEIKLNILLKDIKKYNPNVNFTDSFVTHDDYQTDEEVDETLFFKLTCSEIDIQGYIDPNGDWDVYYNDDKKRAGSGWRSFLGYIFRRCPLIDNVPYQQKYWTQTGFVFNYSMVDGTDGYTACKSKDQIDKVLESINKKSYPVTITNAYTNQKVIIENKQVN